MGGHTLQATSDEEIEKLVVSNELYILQLAKGPCKKIDVRKKGKSLQRGGVKDMMHTFNSLY